ncbi:hypothetical protein ACM66B_000673 [Microbotryomycetes sp. NB124-2]
MRHVSTPMTTCESQARVLPNAAHLHLSSACPRRELIAVTSSPSSGPSTAQATASKSDAKLSLYRTSRAIELVWDWTPPPRPATASANAAPPPSATAPKGPLAARAALLRGKQKAPAAETHVEAIAWHPSGDYLAAVVSTTENSVKTLAVHYLQVDSGQSPIAPVDLPLETRSISHLSWQPLASTTDPLVQLHARKVILNFKDLPPLPKDPTQLPGAAGVAGAPLGGIGVAAAAAAAAAGVATRPGAATSALFGAKNAMLQKEREKEAGRPLQMATSAKGWPALLPSKQLDRDKMADWSLSSALVIGVAQGATHVYLEGTIFLATIAIEPNTMVAAAQVVNVRGQQPRICLSVLDSDSQLLHRTLQPKLPAHLCQFLVQADLLRQMTQHAVDGLQEGRTVWDESRRLGKGWLARINDLSSSHAVTRPATTQLLMLLTTGRPSLALQDFLASKMNERSLDKWISTTEEALNKLRQNTLASIQPAIERIILVLDELKGWTLYKEKFAEYGLRASWIGKGVLLACEIIKASVKFETLIVEEHRCFNEFVAWIRYEFERVAQQEGSGPRPSANYRPVPVAHFIRRSLSESAVSPFLDFGMATTPLDSNAILKAGQAWLDSVEIDERTFEPVDDEVDWPDKLDKLVRRLKEELQGQFDAEDLERTDAERAQPRLSLSSIPVPFSKTESRAMPPFPDSDAQSRARERPEREKEVDMLDTRSRPVSTLSTPSSLPVLLHLLAELVSTNLQLSVQSVGRRTTLSEGQSVGRASPSTTVRARAIKRGKTGQSVLTAWIGDGTFWLVDCDPPTNSTRRVGAKLRLQDERQVEVVAFDYYDDQQLLMALKVLSASGSGYLLASVALDPLLGHATTGDVQPLPHLDLSHQIELDKNYPPEQISINGDVEVQSVFVLSSEGRRLEVLPWPSTVVSGQVRSAGDSEGHDVVMS